MKFQGEPKRRLKANRSEEVSRVLSTAMHLFFYSFHFSAFHSIPGYVCLVSTFEMDQNATVNATILCLVFCIYDVMKKAVMCGERIKVQGFIELFAPRG